MSESLACPTTAMWRKHRGTQDLVLLHRRKAHYRKLAAQKVAALHEQANNGAHNNATGREGEGVIDNYKKRDNDNCHHNSQISPNS